MTEITRVTSAYTAGRSSVRASASGESVEAAAARQDEILRRLEELDDDPASTEARDGPERDRLIREYADTRAAASAKLAEIRRSMSDPANCESGDDHGYLPKPVIRVGDVWRHRRPWQNLDPADYRTGDGMASRAHAVLDALDDDFMPRPAKDRLAEQFDDPREREVATRLAVALSDPEYLQAWRCMMIDPDHGDRLWTSGQRQAWANVGMVARSASLGTASLGFMLPLNLDPSIILVNQGAANPWRQLSTIKQTTSNTWNGVTSAGGTAVWLGEGAEASDNTPTTQQLTITPRKGAAWVFGSYESIGSTGIDGDTAFAEQVPKLLADMKDRLEADSFCNGNGVAPNPTGFLTAYGTANDFTAAGTAVRAPTDLYSLLEGVAPRYRGQAARLGWMGSLTYLDRYRMTPQFSGAQGTATSSVVDDSGTLPRIAGYSFYEMSAWPSGTAVGQRVVAFGDWSQVYIADRWPGYTLYEPMVKGTASGFPTGQSGFFYVWRSNLAITTTNAFKVLRLT